MPLVQSVMWTVSCALTTVITGILICAIAVWIWPKRRKNAVGFFHPYTNDGGGGERVLWCAVRAIQEEAPSLDVVIYTGDDTTSDDLASRALTQFGVRLLFPPMVVKLQWRLCVEASTYPYFTLLGQSLGSIILGVEALTKMTPLIFFDTSGYAFTYPVARGFGCTVVCYTHYPTISYDMLARVLLRTSTYNNSALIAKSIFLSFGKAFYYCMMTMLYGMVGRCAQLAMVNSCWTQAHIEKVWGKSGQIVCVYPPCDTQTLQVLPLGRNMDRTFFISVAQFRPEKAHGLQLEAFAEVCRRLCMASGDKERQSPVRLKLVGSCRHKEDEDRVEKLKCQCVDLGIQDQVDFHINVPYRELVELLGRAIGGLHSMIDEHFGIVVVEYMAAGTIPIAHNSAGPKMDIIVDEDGQMTGFLATTAEEYADAMMRVLQMTEEEYVVITLAARKRALSFSEDRFDERLKRTMSYLLSKASKRKF